MAKKVVKTIEKQVEVTVCDICSNELPLHDVSIDITWSQNCPYDNCYDDYGSLNFCSYGHFVEGAQKLLDKVDKDEDFYMRSVTIRASSTGQDGTLTEMLKTLARLSNVSE